MGVLSLPDLQHAETILPRNKLSGNSYWLTVQGDAFASAEYSLSNELAELHHAGSLQGEDPNSADKMGASRCTLKPFCCLQTLRRDAAVLLAHAVLIQDWS